MEKHQYYRNKENWHEEIEQKRRVKRQKKQQKKMIDVEERKLGTNMWVVVVLAWRTLFLKESHVSLLFNSLLQFSVSELI